MNEGEKCGIKRQGECVCVHEGERGLCNAN